MTQLFDEVVDIIHKISGIDKSVVKPESNLITDLKIDSLDFLDITYEIDKKFNISIPVEEWVEEANAQTPEAQNLFTFTYFIERIQRLIDEKK